LRGNERWGDLTAVEPIGLSEVLSARPRESGDPDAPMPGLEQIPIIWAHSRHV